MMKRYAIPILLAALGAFAAQAANPQAPTPQQQFESGISSQKRLQQQMQQNQQSQQQRLNQDLQQRNREQQRQLQQQLQQNQQRTRQAAPSTP